MKNTNIAKLITGEVVIGYFEDNNEEFLRECYILILNPTEDGKSRLNLYPYMVPFTDKGSDIDSNAIICTVRVPEELEKKYFETISGILMP